MGVSHQFQSGRAENGDPGAIQPTHWDAPHVLTGMLAALDTLAPAPNVVVTLGASAEVALVARASFAPALSPVFTGVPIAPTPNQSVNSDQVATTAYVRTSIINLIGGAPGALDTLQELADAINGDAGYAATVTAALGMRLRVDAVQSLNPGQKAQGVANLGLATVAVSGNYSDLSGKPTLGTAAALNVGTSANQVVQLESGGKLPAVDGSQLTNLPGAIDTVGSIEHWPTNRLKAGRLRADGSSFVRATYPALAAYLVQSGVVTFTNGSTTINWPNHGREVNDPIKLFTTGTLPTNFAAGTHGLPTVGTNYVVQSVIDANNIRLSAAAGGSAISAGSAGSGTHTAVCAPHGSGDGSVTATLPDLRGEFVRGLDDNRGVDSNRVIGSSQSDALQNHAHDGQFDFANNAQGGTGGNGFTGGSKPTGSPTANGAGTPRVASETRPRNIALLATIRYV